MLALCVVTYLFVAAGGPEAPSPATPAVASHEALDPSFDGSEGLDPSFSGDGVAKADVRTAFPDATDVDGCCLVRQPDGKLVVLIRASHELQDRGSALVRFRPDGELDTTFGGDGYLTSLEERSLVFAGPLAVQPDGKLIVGGNGRSGFENGYVRLTADGEVDRGYGSDGWVTYDEIRSESYPCGSGGATFRPYGPDDISAPKNDRISIVGSGQWDLDAGGPPDMGTFWDDGPGGSVPERSCPGHSNDRYPFGVSARAVLARPSGPDHVLRHYESGSGPNYESGSGHTWFDVSTHNPQKDGPNVDGSNGTEGSDLLLLPSGKTLALGTIRGEDFSTLRVLLTRYTADDSLDEAFGAGGKVVTPIGGTGNDLAIQSTGRVIATNENGDVAGFREDGSLDTSFGQGGEVAMPALADYYDYEPQVGSNHRSLVVQPDDKIVLAGEDHTVVKVARLLPDGQGPASATPPRQALQSGTQLGSSSLPITVTWSGTKPPFDLQRRTGTSTSWAPVASRTAATNTRLSLALSAWAQFRVQAAAGTNHTSPWAQGPTFTPLAFQESARSFKYIGSWTRASDRSASGRSVKASTAKGAKATLTFTGRNAALVMPLKRTLGAARVCLDPGTAGQVCQTVDQSPSVGLGARKLVFARNGLSTSKSHKIQVTVASGRVELDGAVVLR